MNIQLTPKHAAFVHKKVEGGCYNSADEVVNDALRVLEERDQLLELHREEFRKKINEGLESLSRGEGVDDEKVFARIEAECLEIEKGSARDIPNML